MARNKELEEYLEDNGFGEIRYLKGTQQEYLSFLHSQVLQQV